MILNDILQKDERAVLTEWMQLQLSTSTMRRDLMSEEQLRQESQRFLKEFRAGVASGELTDISQSSWSGAHEVLRELSQSRAAQGFTASETAMFVFSLKQPLFGRVAAALIGEKDGARFRDETWALTTVVDKLGLYTTEVYLEQRERIIARQQQEMMELSTPVVELWDRVLAVPLIGTLDSARTQVVMESLLQRIVDSGAEIAIIDITGVPTVDTLVAQHLLKTVEATRLMGADCIISGIRPQIAQTIVQLGVDLNVVSKATLADAFALALRRLGSSLVRNPEPRGRS